MSGLGLDVGQANELKLAFRRYSWNNETIKHLCESDVLGDALDILRGDAVAVPVERVLNLNTPPVMEEGHSVVCHNKCGKKVLWRQLKPVLMDPEGLHYDHWEQPGHSFWKELCLNPRTMRPKFLRGQTPANIHLRDFFIKNPHLIPRHWYSSQPVLFWGTLCRSPNGLYVPGLSLTFGRGEKYNRRVDDPKACSGPMLQEQYKNPAVVLV